MKNTINIFFALAMVVILIPSCSNAQKSSDKSITKNISTAEFKKKIEANPNGQILDVRTPEEQTQGYLKGAQFMNFYDKAFETQLEKLNKKEPIYVYCRSGGRSGKTMKKLNKLGFERVYNMDGGMIDWNKQGYPIEK